MRIIKAESVRALAEALSVLDRGGIIAYPTESYYALGVRFDMEDSLKKLYTIKRRPREKAMPLIVGSTETLFMVARPVNRIAEIMIYRYWPGAVTLVLDAEEGVSPFITAGGRVAVRIPGDSFALDLARAAGFPITATSANPSGEPPARDAESVKRYFGDGIDLVVDGGKTPGGPPSTIVDTDGGRINILRQGAVKIEL